MRIERGCAFLLVLGLAASSNVTFAGQQYDQCVMQSLRGARNNNATALLTDACDKLYNNGSLLAPRDRNYYGCILQNLPGVEANLAAQQIAAACRRQNRM